MRIVGRSVTTAALAVGVLIGAAAPALACNDPANPNAPRSSNRILAQVAAARLVGIGAESSVVGAARTDAAGTVRTSATRTEVAGAACAPH